MHTEREDLNINKDILKGENGTVLTWTGETRGKIKMKL